MRRLRVLIPLLFFLPLIVSCFRVYEDIDEGFSNLKAGNFDIAGGIFNKCINYGRDSIYSSRANEGLGWISYLEGNLDDAILFFGEALELYGLNTGARSGLFVSLSRAGNWNGAVTCGVSLADMETYEVDYLPDPLTVEEIVKLMATGALLAGDDDIYGDAVSMISDDVFLERLALIRGE